MIRRKLAVLLHEHQCAYDHTDQCAWWYEADHPDCWDRSTHRAWLARADTVLALNPEITLADLEDVSNKLSEAYEQLRKWTR